MIHLHRHSEYSRLDGVGTAQQYAEQAAKMGHWALALTDHGTLSGALHHILACRNRDSSGKPVREGDPIIPISGVEAYFRQDRSIRDDSNRPAYHLCLFAKNLGGWHNLLRITSVAYRESDDNGGGFYRYPCVDWELLERYSEGLICSSACISSYLSFEIQRGNDIGANKFIKRMKRIFGENFWLEIMPHDFEGQRIINIEIANLAQQHSVPIIATTDAHYPYKEWAETQQVAKLMSTKTSFKDLEKAISKKKAEGEDGDHFAKLLPSAYLMEEKDVRSLFAEAHPNLPEFIVDEAIKNTHLLARSTKPFLLNRRDKLPKVSDSPEDAKRIVYEWCYEGLDRIGHADTDEYIERLDYEMGVLESKGVLDYFVLVGKVVRWAKDNGILVGLGRGSAAGSLVSYLCKITSIDPIAWGLLFERFLNPDRKGLPDIDLDFQHDRRDEVKEYISKEFGADHVADIISHQTFAPKKVLIDVARTFDVPSREVDEVSKAIDIRPDDEETALEEIRPINEKLDQFASKHPDVWEHALRLEGSVANASKHAAGVVITDKPITEYMPLERGKKGDQVTSWSDRADFPAVSENGLVKLDALGVKGKTKQAVALELIRDRHEVTDVELDQYGRIDLDALPPLQDPRDVDPKVMEIFSSGLTLGVWQFGGRGITNLIKQIKPDWAGDLTAANALYRPGPMGLGATWEYPELKEDPERVEIWDESIRFALAETFGIIAYQEQVMEICKALGDFTPAEADYMRKAMGKLYRLPGSEAQKFMSQFKSQWDKGTKAHGLSEQLAQYIWERILSFGGYGFNKSHSASYAVQAYQDAWLKAYYPHEFFCALLRFPPSTTQKNAHEKSRFIQAVVRECDVLEVDIAPPRVSHSEQHFSLDGDTLRFGLESIKDVGTAAAKKIISERPFDDWEDFVKRTKKQCNSSVRKALIHSGAMDEFGMRDDWSGTKMAAAEKRLLGLAMTMTSESQRHKPLLEEHTYTAAEFEDMEDGDEVVCGGDVIDVSETTVKKGKTQGMEMGFVTVAFGLNQFRCTFFPEQWARHKQVIEGGTLVVVGKKDTWKGTGSVVVNDALDIESWAENIHSENQMETAA